MIVLVLEHLQVEQSHLMAGLAAGFGHPLQPQRLEPEINLGVHQTAGMNEKDLHGAPPSAGF